MAAEQQCEPCEPCLMGCGRLLIPKKFLIGIMVYYPKKIGLCPECYRTKTPEEISTRLKTHPEQDFTICIEEQKSRRDTNKEVKVYVGCGQLFSDTPGHGKDADHNCCEMCGTGKQTSDVISDPELIANIKSSEFGLIQCGTPLEPPMSYLIRLYGVRSVPM